MALVRWKPASELQREIDDMVNTFWGTPFTRTGGGRMYPAVDVYEYEDRYTLQADLPGMAREDFNVSVKEGVLTIEGEKKQAAHDPNAYARQERGFGRFTRTFNLGNDVDAGAISATYKDGVLTLEVPKAEEARPRQIDIQIS